MAPAVRFAFGAAASVVAGIVTLLHGPVAGGVFLAFPAVLPATLTLLERDKGVVAAVADARGAVIGALALIPFAATVIALHGRVAVALSVVAALGAWAAASLLLFGAGMLAKRPLRPHRYPPEVPVSLAQPLVDALRRGGTTAVVVDAGAGGALAAVLAESDGASEAVNGSVVSSGSPAACAMLGVEDSACQPSAAVAVRLARAARARWRTTMGFALIGTSSAPLPVETFHVAAVDGCREASRTFDADRGGEGTWGEAVQQAVAFLQEAVRRHGATTPAIGDRRQT